MDLVTSVALGLLALVLSRAALGVAYAHKFYPDKIIVKHYKRLKQRLAKFIARARVEEKPPVLEDAPGIFWKRVKHGWSVEWRAPSSAVERGWVPRKLRLWRGDKDALNSNIKGYIQDRAKEIQNEMDLWLGADLRV